MDEQTTQNVLDAALKAGEEQNLAPISQELPQSVAQEAPAAPKPQVVLKTKATIQFLDAEGKVTESKECWRNIPSVIRTLGADFATRKDARVRVIVEPEVGSPGLTDEAGNATDYIMAEGTVHEALSTLIEKALHPSTVFNEFQRMSSFMADRSDLKGMIITVVFGDAQAGGFGMLSTTAEVTDTDIKTLVDAAADQTQQMMDEMKKTHPSITFKNDKGGLILPSRLR
jgi:hypothetical protein